MTTTLKKSLAAVALLGAVFAFSATTVKADTLTDLTNQLAALQAQIAALTGGSTSCTTFGLPGVMGIQKAVNHMGYAPALTTDGVSGPKTRAGIMWAQAKLGVTADGVWGNISNSAYVAWVASACGDDDNSDDDNDDNTVDGDAGALNDADFTSGLNNEEVGEGQEDIAVVGMDLEADEGSDLRLTSVRVEFDQTSGQASSDDLDDYADSVSVWFEGEMVGEADVDDMSENSGVWSKSISLDSDAVIDAGETAELVVAVTAANAIDADDLRTDGATKGGWDVSIANVRFEDGQGVVTTESTLGDIGSIDGSDFRSFFFDTFLAAGDVELTLREGDNNPDSQAVEAEENGNTDNVLLLTAELEAEEAEVEIKDMTVTITPAGTGDGDEIASSIILVIGDEEFSVDAGECETAADCDGDSSSDATTALVYVFDDIDMVIDAGDTVDVEVRADINEVDGTIVVGGDSLTADIDNSDTTAESDGEDLTSSELSGSVNGNAQAFYETGIIVTPGDMNIEVTPVDGAADYSEAKLTFDVMAFGMDVYLDKTVASSTSTSTTAAGSNRAVLVTSAGANLTLTGASLSPGDQDGNNEGDSDEETNSFLISDGDTATFTMTLNATGTAAQTRGIMYALEWGNGDTATQDSVYTFDMGVDGSYKTGYVFVSGS